MLIIVAFLHPLNLQPYTASSRFTCTPYPWMYRHLSHDMET